MIKILYIVEPMLGIGPNIDANLIAKKAASKFLGKIDIKIILEKDNFAKEQAPNVSWEYFSIPWRLDLINNKLLNLNGSELTEEEKRVRISSLLNICKKYKPDVLLLHNYMSGSKWDSVIDFEMLPLINFAKKQNKYLKVYSYMIGMLDSFENITKKDSELFINEVKKNIDKVFLRSDNLPLFIKSCPPAASIINHFLPVGYSADDEIPERSMDSSDEKYIIVSAGGGDIGLNLFKKAIEACSLSKSLTNLKTFRWKIFLGPMQEKNELLLRNYTNSLGCSDKIILITKADEKVFLSNLIYNCLVSISQCGQRTFTNLEVSGANSIVIPRESEGKELEQLYRAQYLREIGRAKLIREYDLTPEILIQNIVDIYKGKVTKIGLQMNGPENLLNNIVELSKTATAA